MKEKNHLTAVKPCGWGFFQKKRDTELSKKRELDGNQDKSSFCCAFSAPERIIQTNIGPQ